MKKSFLLLLILFFASGLFFGSEKSNNIVKEEIYKTSLPQFNYSLHIKKYSSSREKAAKGFVGMGITGTVLIGASTLFIVCGIFFVVYSFNGGFLKDSLEQSDNTEEGNIITFIGGAFATVFFSYFGFILLVLGGACLLVGLPLMIVGFVMAHRLRGDRVSFFIDGEKSFRTGVAIRFN